MLPVCYQGTELPLPGVQVPTVYMLQIEGVPIFTKVGVSTRPTARLVSLQSGQPNPFREVVLYLFRDKMAAMDAERAMHGVLQDHRHRAEWFRGPIAELQPRLKGFFRPEAVLRPDWPALVARWSEAKTDPGGILGAVKADVLAMHAEGYTATEIAERFDVSRQSVLNRLREWGEVPGRPGRRYRKEAAA